MPESDAVPPALKARVEALLKGAIPAAPPGPGAIFPVTWVMLGIAVLMVLSGLAVSLTAKNKSDEGCMAVGLGLGGICFFVFLILLIVDLTTPSPKTRTTPERGVKAFYGALRRKSYGRAYACLSPLDRIPDLRPTMAIPRLDVKEESYSFDKKEGFAKYWRAQSGLASGFLGGYNKTIQAKVLGVSDVGPNLAMADVELLISGFPTTAYLGLFCGALPAVILILVLTRRETFRVRKLLVKRDNLWWMVNGEFTPEGDEAIEQQLTAGL